MKNDKMMYYWWYYVLLRNNRRINQYLRGGKFGFFICLILVCTSCQRLSEDARKLQKIDPAQVLSDHYTMYSIGGELESYGGTSTKNDQEIATEVYRNFVAGILSAITLDLINGG